MDGALAGVRVADFGQWLAGPLVATWLADAGADVVRVDPPGGPRWHHPANAMLQRGKRSIVLDLKNAADRRVARALAERADVVVENFRPGVMDRLGLGPQAMLAANPRLLYCSLPGFGADDPRAGLPVERQHPGFGRAWMAGPSRRLSLTPPRPGRPVGPPGSDTRAVLDELGFDSDDLIGRDVARDGLPEGTTFVGMFR